MIRFEQLKNLTDWFSDYVRTFLRDDPLYDRNIILKEEHTYRVCREIRALGESIGLQENLLLLAEITALLHDIGRFEQYARYKTFVDKHSENHASLGLKVIDRLDLLNGFEQKSGSLVKTAIANHNLAAISPEVHDEALLLAKLIRDADKLDIWKVVTDYYRQGPENRNKAIELDLPDSPDISAKVFADLQAGNIINSSDLKCLNDFKILQLAWVYDLNFAHSKAEFLRRGYLKAIAGTITDSERADQAVSMIRSFLSH